MDLWQEFRKALGGIKMYIKLIGSLFLLGAAASIGFMKSEELVERVKNLQEMKRMMILLQGELRFHRAALSEAFGNVAERVKEPFCSFLREMGERLERREESGFDEIWGETSAKIVVSEGMKKEDGQLLELLKNSLGYLDLTLQTETLNLAILQTEEMIKRAKEQQERKGKLYQTMGITVGALLILLII